MTLPENSLTANSFALVIALVILLVWVFTATAAGRTLVRLLPMRWQKDCQPAELWIASLLAGLLVTLVLSIILMESFGLTSANAYGILIVLAITGWPNARHLIADVRRLTTFLGEQFRKDRSWITFAFAVTTAILAILILSAFLPSQNSDELGYHVWNPIGGRFFLLAPELKNLERWMPRNIESFFFFLRMLAGGFVAAKLFQVMLWAVSVFFLCFYLYRLSNDLALSFLGSILALLCFKHVYGMTPTFMVDAGTHAFLLIAGLALFSWLEDESVAIRLVIAGLAAGLGLGSKFYALFYVFSFFIVVSMSVLLKTLSGRKTHYGALAAFILLTGIGSAFWYLKNLYYSGNPFYPFLFGHAGYTDQEMAQLSQQISRLAFMFRWERLYQLAFEKHPSLQLLSLIPLLILPLVLLSRRYRKEFLVAITFLAILVTTLFVVVGGIYPRYHLSLFVFGSLLFIFSIFSVVQTKSFFRTGGLFLFAIAAAGGTTMAFKALRPAFAVQNFLGKIPPAEKYKVPTLAALEINEMEGGRDFHILILDTNDFFSFYRPPDRDRVYTIRELIKNDYLGVSDEKNFLERLRSLGITHYLSPTQEEFSYYTASRTSLQEFMGIYGIREILLKASSPIRLTSTEEYSLRKITYPE